MQLYPDLPAQRRSMIANDVVVLLLVVAFAVLGWVLYDIIERITVVATGVEEAGLSVQSAFDEAADAAGSVPVIGGELADVLTDAGDDTGGRVAELGQEGRDRIQRAAVATGLITFALPSAVLLAAVVPQRIEQVRRMHAARTLFAQLHDPGRRRLIAMRAAFTLPADVLLRHTPDPMGDLLAERFDGLIAALLAEAGIRAPEPPDPQRRVR